jgi:hypothetical protein
LIVLYGWLAIGFVYCAWSQWRLGSITANVIAVLRTLGVEDRWAQVVGVISYMVFTILLWPIPLWLLISRRL